MPITVEKTVRKAKKSAKNANANVVSTEKKKWPLVKICIGALVIFGLYSFFFKRKEQTHDFQSTYKQPQT